MQAATQLKRDGSGVLLAPSALKSPYGTGTITGPMVFRWIHFLAASGFSYWQILPNGEPDIYNSPYMDNGGGAGNKYSIFLPALVDMGLISKADLRKYIIYSDKVDYDQVKKNYDEVLYKAYKNRTPEIIRKMEKFCKERKGWAEDYALFRALVDFFAQHGVQSFAGWPEDIRNREPEAMKYYADILKDEIGFVIFTQFLFFTQFAETKAYANKRGIRIIGDLPIYLSCYSYDLWRYRKYFLIEKDLSTKRRAGVPADAFSETGQLWGNPLYNWEELKKDGYSWWIDRVRRAHELYDVIRLDHFRAFSQYWEVDEGAIIANDGAWHDGPGMDFFNALKEALDNPDIILEDLGVITQDVHALRDATGYDGMCVIIFALDCGNKYDIHFPKNAIKKVVYTGTHDTETVTEKLMDMFDKAKVDWRLDTEGLQKALKEQSEDGEVNRIRWALQVAMEELGWPDMTIRYEILPYYLELGDKEAVKRSPGFAAIREAMASKAEIVIINAADIVSMGKEGRINVPGTTEDNWNKIMSMLTFNPIIMDILREYNEQYGRCVA